MASGASREPPTRVAASTCNPKRRMQPVRFFAISCARIATRHAFTFASPVTSAAALRRRHLPACTVQEQPPDAFARLLSPCAAFCLSTAMAPTPLPHKKIIKKRTLKFPRHQSDEFVKVKSSWRRPRGIDSRQRIKYAPQRTRPLREHSSAAATCSSCRLC